MLKIGIDRNRSIHVTSDSYTLTAASARGRKRLSWEPRQQECCPWLRLRLLSNVNTDTYGEDSDCSNDKYLSVIATSGQSCLKDKPT